MIIQSPKNKGEEKERRKIEKQEKKRNLLKQNGKEAMEGK